MKFPFHFGKHNEQVDVSIIVPVFNEEGNVARLHAEIVDVMEEQKYVFEIIFVDDHSTDKTFVELKNLKPINIIRFRQNCGQSSALDAGIKVARGKLIVTMDGDGQNDPRDIPALIQKLNEGYDAVCGWRFQRKDALGKKVISLGAKFLRRLLVKDDVHDSGCTLRVYHKECFEDLDLYGEMHRMIPALLKWRGFQITELKVNHRPRIAGQTKYKWQRMFVGFLDMIYIWFWRKYSSRPLYLFGMMGLGFVGTGGMILFYMMTLKILFQYELSQKIWPLVGFVFVLIGLQFLMTGLIAVNIVEIGKIRKYYIKEVVNN